MRSPGLRSVVIATTALAAIGAGRAAAEPTMSPDAHEILLSMSKFLAHAQKFSVDFDADTEIVTGTGRKIQLSASGDIIVERPDKVHVDRMGQLADAEIVYDGKTISLLGKRAKLYFQLPSTHGLDLAIEDFRVATGAGVPAADLLASDPYHALTEGVEEGDYLGIGYVDGVPCYHLAFRTQSLDWQIWVGADKHPVPMKYVITTKWVTGAPEYSLRLRNWNFAPHVNDATFTFTPPADAHALDHVTVNDEGELVLGAH